MLLSTRQRRCYCLLLFGAYSLASLGLPLAAPVAVVGAGERFPCEACGCGCASAKVCWSKCCCHTLAERLAWAATEGVRPPEAVLASAQRAGYDTSRWTGLAPVPRLTAKPAAERKCCCSKSGCSPAPPTVVAEAPPHPVETAEPGWRQLACQGALKLWLALATAPPVSGTPLAIDAPAEPVTPRPAARFTSLSLSPPTPPPRTVDALHQPS